MPDFGRNPCGSTDEDGEQGYVDVTASTATQAAARHWLLTDGAQDVLGVHAGYRKARPEGLELRHLTVVLPPCDRLPERVDVADLLRNGQASGWWQFDISMATEDIEPADGGWRAEFARRDAERTAEAKRRAVENRGSWWWRLRCRIADRALSIASALDPGDRSSVGWIEAGFYVSRQVRLPRDQTAF